MQKGRPHPVASALTLHIDSGIVDRKRICGWYLGVLAYHSGVDGSDACHVLAPIATPIAHGPHVGLEKAPLRLHNKYETTTWQPLFFAPPGCQGASSSATAIIGHHKLRYRGVLGIGYHVLQLPPIRSKIKLCVVGSLGFMAYKFNIRWN